jgi:hypothetical protein
MHKDKGHAQGQGACTRTRGMHKDKDKDKDKDMHKDKHKDKDKTIGLKPAHIKSLILDQDAGCEDLASTCMTAQGIVSCTTLLSTVLGYD